MAGKRRVFVRAIIVRRLKVNSGVANWMIAAAPDAFASSMAGATSSAVRAEKTKSSTPRVRAASLNACRR